MNPIQQHLTRIEEEIKFIREYVKLMKENKEALPCPHGRLPVNGQHGYHNCPHCNGWNDIK